MSNGSEECCALGICCPPASVQQKNALAKIITDNAASPLTADSAAACVLEHFDLAPTGQLQPMLQQIAKMARSQGV
jgi:hypothetical protein